MRLIFLFLWIPFILFSQEVNVTASLEDTNPVENRPITGTITVTHSSKTPIDTSNFTIEGKPLQVEFIKDVKVSSDGSVIVSIYHFKLPPLAKGLQVLPQITVKVGDRKYNSIPSTFSVSEMPHAASSEEIAATLKLEQKIQGATLLYPGQKAKIIYRYIYSGNIELTEEKLPLLEADGFRKVSDKVIKDYTEGGYSIQEITQEIQAIKPGTYTFGPSTIEGVAYQQELGKRVYSSNKLHSETQPVNIVVAAFPENGKPTSFSGAVGSFNLKVSLLTPAEMTVGDKITLSIDISGDPVSLDTLQPPDLCCQPGFSGMFRQSDLPPLGSSVGNHKQFKAEMRPLSSSIREIPSIEFSSFDPTTKKYLILHSPPIPIKVNPGKQEQNAQQTPLPAPSENPQPISTEVLKQPSPIEIEANFPLQPDDLNNRLFGTWWVLLLIPVGGALLVLQSLMKQYMDKMRTQIKQKNSQELFQEALKIGPDSPQFFRLLNQAFLEKLKEKGIVKDSSIIVEKLSKEGLPGEVRKFLSLIEEERFTGKEFTQKRMDEAKVLFNKIGA